MPENTEEAVTATEAPVPVATDIFCGVGGLTHGLISAGIQVTMGVDVDESCRYAYEHNNAGAQFLCRDVAQLSVEELAGFYPENSIRILAGCAPCKPFSTYTRNKDDHEDYELLGHFANFAEGLNPTIVSMENVPQLRKYPIYEDFLETLREHEYFVWEEPVYCPDYGVPQRRTRLVLLASKLGPIGLIAPTHDEDARPTVRDAIGHLPPLIAGGVSPDDPLHRCHRLSPLNLERIRATPEGGGWSEWPDRLKLECHKKPSGATYGSVYGRMWWDQPASTMTTQCCGLGNGRFGHPEQDRAISLREAALFQSFPADYKFFAEGAPFSIDSLERHIGNAVPVRLGEVVGLSISRHLESYRDDHNNDLTKERN
jgi:DNA (cytosine-5)-methyltransferase 1